MPHESAISLYKYCINRKTAVFQDQQYLKTRYFTGPDRFEVCGGVFMTGNCPRVNMFSLPMLIAQARVAGNYFVLVFREIVRSNVHYLNF